MADSTGNRLRQDRSPLPPERDWRAVWFALALFVAQAILSVHSVEHLGDHEEEAACELCILGGGLDHAAVDATRPVLPRFPVACVDQLPDYLSARGSTAPFRQRAPPFFALTS